MYHLHNHLGKLAIAAAVVLTGCQDKTESTSSVTATQAVAATQDVEMLDGAIMVKIPHDMEQIVDQGNVQGYADSNGSVMLATAPAAQQKSSDLLDQTVANLKNMDPDAQEVRKYEIDMAGTKAHAVEVKITTNGQKVYMAMALAVINDNLVSIQVMGPQGKPEDVVARAKRVYSSLAVATK